MTTTAGIREEKKSSRRGLLDREKVRWVSFMTITLSLIVSIITCILAIWDFTQEDTLWRMVATCVVVSGGMIAFALINALYGSKGH